jgi:mRNA interferase MazF
MVSILRGDIYWADLDPARGREQSGRRPVLVISHETFNTPSETVIALAITSRAPRAGFPLTCPLPPRLLPHPSWVKTSQIRVLAVERLGRKIGRLDESEVNRIIEGLLDIIGP